MKIKICGMKFSENIKDISCFCPDFMGFIFYENSKRLVTDSFQELNLQSIPPAVKKVGVFVNQSFNEIMQKAIDYKLDYVQLHGQETIDLLESLKQKNIKIIKAFGISNSFDFETLKKFENICDYFLFDTLTSSYGGSGKIFNWKILENYHLKTPFFLSGGLGMENLESLIHFKHEKLIGFDFNSKLEIASGFKDLKQTKMIIENIRNEKF